MIIISSSFDTIRDFWIQHVNKIQIKGRWYFLHRWGGNSFMRDKKQGQQRSWYLRTPVSVWLSVET